MRRKQFARLGLALPITVSFAAPASAALPNCSVAALSGYSVANVSITSATDIAAAPPDPEYCKVEGTVTTSGEGAAPGAAEFVVKLPAGWSNRLVFFGCGGNCGSVKSVAANPVDVAAALGSGFATVNTDAGHEQDPTTPDPTWILRAPGIPDEPAIVDFHYRAVHDVAVTAKALTADYYGDGINHAYFDGCSTGGRQSLMEGERYPEDFDGLIAGDPIMDLDNQRAATVKQAKAFLDPAAYIPFATIPAVDAAVMANCDAVDGVADGLIQNPAKCSFDPKSLVPATLTAAQAQGLTLYLKGIVDTAGKPVAPGMTAGGYATAGFEGTTELATPAVGPTAAEPWGGIGKGPSSWLLGDAGIRYFIERDPAYDVNNDWPETGSVIAATAVALLKQRSGAGDSDDPAKLHDFLRQGRKLFLYHGFSDDEASPYRTIWFYKTLAAQERGYANLQQSARLFMVPGMGHCGNGAGPNSFATLSALDAWVSTGVAPEGIVATNTTSGRTMPLCKFPEEARDVGGPVDAAESWVCRASDQRLLGSGVDGVLAGAGRDYGVGR